MNQQFGELLAVKATIQRYIDGTYTADIPLLRSAFHEKAVMNGYLGGQLLTGTPEPFFEDIGSHPSMKSTGAPYQSVITSLVVTGDVAEATLAEDGFFGDGCLEDHFHLIKVDGEWKIMSKMFTTK